MSDTFEHQTSPALKMRTFEQFDGSVWRHYESPEAITLLTGVGRELIVAQHLGKLLRDYATDRQQDVEAGNVRLFLAEGGNARVFSVADTRLAMKEKRSGSSDNLFASLNRMDRLIHAAEEHAPKWIGIPQHYGITMRKTDPSRQFMLMEKIDDGVTIGDILGYDQEPREPHLKESITNIFGVPTPELREEIVERYAIAKQELRKALLAEYLSPDEFLPDIDHNRYNIIVEKLDTPVDESPYKFWVIDQ